MKWLLVAFIFIPSPDGGMGEPKVIYKGFPTLKAYNAVGDNFRKVLAMPEGLESVSVCLAKASFNATDWKLIQEPGPSTIG